MFETKGRRVIITGAAQGMGKEFSKILLKSGAKVCISDIDEIKGNETKVLFQQKFGLDDSGVCFVKCNVSKKEDWPKLWDTAEILLKGPIEILINNAGLNPSHGWEKLLDVMLMGAARGIYTAIERMGRSKGGQGGRIVNITSTAGITDMDYGAPIQGHGYSSAKHGLVTLTRAFLFSAPYVFDSEGIKCYALAPTGCDTNLVRSLWSDLRENVNATHEDLENTCGMKILTVEQVGKALMESFNYDKDGAVYAVFPDCPLIEWPNDEHLRYKSIVWTCVYFGNLFKVKLFTWKHFYGIVLFGIILMSYVFGILFWLMF